MQHLFFDCAVAKYIRFTLADFFLLDMPNFAQEIILMWDLADKSTTLNFVCTATLWSLWTIRNELCLNGSTWRNVKCILGMVCRF